MENKAIKLNPRERKELAISEIALIILAAIGLAVVGWLAWFRPSATPHEITTYKACVDAGNPVQLSYPSVCVTKDGKRFTNPEQNQNNPATGTSQSQQESSTVPSTDGQYLVIAEWKIRVLLPAEYNDLKYTYAKDDMSERTSFTFKRLEDIGICKTDVGVSMTRNTTKNEAPYSIDNPEPITQVGEYYYYLSYGGSPCYDAENEAQMKVVKTINDGKLIDAVKQTLKKLQPST